MRKNLKIDGLNVIKVNNLYLQVEYVAAEWAHVNENLKGQPVQGIAFVFDVIDEEVVTYEVECASLS